MTAGGAVTADGSATGPAALAEVIDLVRCPRCGATCALTAGAVRCAQGHSFDLARQGYVNLTGAAQPAHADTPAMVAARTELLDSGRYAPLSEALVAAVPVGSRTLLDVGTGTGHYAAAVLDAIPDARALGLDISVAACRRAARRHPRLAVAAADVWAPFPVVDAAVDVVVSVFSPRNAAEFVRVLRPGGCVITATPGPDHLAELRGTFGLLRVQDDKERRLADAYEAAGLRPSAQTEVAVTAPWTVDNAVRSIMMGPNAFHTSIDEVRATAQQLVWPHPVTLSCVISRWSR